MNPFIHRVTLIALSSLLGVVPAFAGSVLINNVDAPGVGLNDTTPATPVGGNAGTTVGEQALNVFTLAGTTWGDTLDNDVDIVVQATFQPLACDATSGVLGSAGPIQINQEFPGALWPETWHASALANQLAGTDLSPGGFDSGLLAPPFNDDIVTFFNGALGSPGCIEGFEWYLGLDHAQAPNQIDLLAVIMHEYAHGLGFASFTDKSTGAPYAGSNDVYSQYILDNGTGRTWGQLDNKARAASAISGSISWSGPEVTDEAPLYLDAGYDLSITAPSGIAGVIAFGTASFGPAATPTNFGGEVVAAVGADGGTTACGGPLLNASDIVGNIALIDRGTCSFVEKTYWAYAAGASGVLIANNVGGAIGLGGTTCCGISIPTLGIGIDDGADLRANPGATVSYALNGLLAGSDANGLVKLYSPNPVQGGSSVSHWDTLATPSLLMEPSITPALTPRYDQDLTPALFWDIGWDNTLACPVGSHDGDLTVVIGGCDSGVANDLGPFSMSLPSGAGGLASGCSVADVVLGCAGSGSSHGAFVSCVAHVTNELVSEGVISGAEKSAIQSCAAK